ncbi:MAG: NYN domain-containing protein, partial [Erysipelotrichaceae bacterium]|nr:NYN domain-containing protein [Erysipelotrichaceae bacterium]
CQNYAQEVMGYTHGKGKWNASVEGYYPCEDQDKIVEEIGYDPLSDLYHSPDSVFCQHGSGVIVPYYQVEEYMHLPYVMYEEAKEVTSSSVHMRHKVSQDELQEVMNRTYKPKELKVIEKKEVKAAPKVKVAPPKPPYMIIDGYNLIHSYDHLKALAEVDIGHARDALINQLANYQYKYNGKMMVVFDAYKVQEGTGSRSKVGDLEVVYTRSKQTADSFIEQEVSKLKKDYEITVVSSDGWIQNIILGLGAARMSAREFEIILNGIKK